MPGRTTPLTNRAAETRQHRADIDMQRNRKRAVAAYEALQRHFYVGNGSGLYREQYPSGADDNLYSYLWPFSQVLAATIDLAQLADQSGLGYRDDLRDRVAGLERYWSTTGSTDLPGYDSYPLPPFGEGDHRYYDDNEWIAIEQIRLYHLTGWDDALNRAKAIFRLVVSGWDDDPTHPAPGGVFWTQAPSNHDRNTVSTMPGAALGLELYAITRDRFYLDWALQMYEWTNTSLRAPNGLYWDRIDLAGTIERTQWSYNQGVPIGVDVLLFQLTGDTAHLQHAGGIADAALDFYDAGKRLDGQPAFFNAVYFKNLLRLHAVRRDWLYRASMQAYADRVWDNYRDDGTGLFHFDRPKPATLIEQAAMTQIYARLAL